MADLGTGLGHCGSEDGEGELEPDSEVHLWSRWGDWPEEASGILFAPYSGHSPADCREGRVWTVPQDWRRELRHRRDVLTRDPGQ